MRITAAGRAKLVRGQSKRDAGRTVVDWVTRDIDDQPKWIINRKLSDSGWKWWDLQPR